jgi:hypothetical protein
MERERIIQSNFIIHFPPVTIKDRLKKFLGLPKSLRGEYIDNEQCSWRMLKSKKINKINPNFSYSSEYTSMCNCLS